MDNSIENEGVNNKNISYLMKKFIIFYKKCCINININV